MNKVFLIGNLTKDPELKETQSGISVCNFSIAVRRRYAKDGAKKTATEVVVEEVEFLSQKANDEPKKKAAMEEFDDDEGIPF